MDSLTINGTQKSTVVDCLPIHFKWQVAFEQVRFELQVTTHEKSVYLSEIHQKETAYILREIELDKSSKYQVTVNVYGSQGEKVSFSSSFVTSNFGEFDAHWISDSSCLVEDSEYYNDKRNLVFKKELVVSNTIDETYVHIVGLGYYNLYINGTKVSNYELNNDWTNYNEIVYYDTFDIQGYLNFGHNEVLVELANGWYNPAPMTLFGKYNLRQNLTTGKPTLLAQVVMKSEGKISKTVATDKSWSVAEGPYLFNNMYLGEVIDFRLFDTEEDCFKLHNTDWVRASEVQGPSGKLRSSYIEKIVKGVEVTPKEVYSIDDKRHIIDFGTMVSGFIDATFSGKSGQVIEFVYSEEINADKTLNTDSSLAGFIGKNVAENVVVPGGFGCPERAEQRDKCICRDGVMEFCNQYTYHSFRFVEVSGLSLEQLKGIKAIYAHNQLHEVGHFKCSNAYVSRLYDAAKVTKLNNIHSVIEDCARERFAYGGDMVALAPSQVMMFDSAKLYEKTIFDFIADKATNGGFPETAPFMGIQTKGTGEGAGPLGWQLAVPYLLKMHYQYYGSIELVKQVYPHLQAQFDHLSSLNFDELDNYCLGDWGSKVADKENIKHGSPALSFTACCFYYYHLLLLVHFSKLIGLVDNELEYQQLADNTKQKIIAKFRNEDGSYSDRSQTSYVFALYFELENEPNVLVKQLENAIVSSGFDLQFGIFGQGFFYSIANKYDLNHLVFDCLENELGVKSMLNDGNGALKEFFGDNENGSSNHAMFSSYAYWFYNGLGGISVGEEACGADQITVKPYFATHIDEVDCSFSSNQGKVISRWKRNGSKINLDIQIPYGVKESLVVLPKAYEAKLDGHLISHLDEKHVYIDISETKALNISVNTDLVHAKERC